jgi:hypothetical protein
VDLRDISPRKPENNGISFLGLVRRNNYVRTSGFGFAQGLGEIRHFISRRLRP